MTKSVVVIRKGDDGKRLAYEALGEIGGEEMLVGCRRVLIKPNITANMPASTGVVTYPSMVEGVLQFLRDNSAEDIILGEGGGCDITKAFKDLGFSEVVRRYGARLVDFNRDREVFLQVPNPLKMEGFGIAKTVTECDLIINLPCLKIHGGESQVTLCMKNMMGCIARNRGIMHRDFNEKIVDLLKVVSPGLNIIDGIVGLEGGEIHGDPVGAKVIIASRDFVAADAVGAAVMGFEEGEVGHIALAEKLGFGRGRLKDIDVRGASIESVMRPFRRAK